MKTLVLVAGLLLALPVAAEAAVALINNGLDCSNPGNVIDDATYQSDGVVVRNVGCGTPDPWSPCPSPGDPTEVCVEVGGGVYDLYARDTSAITMNGGNVEGGLGASNFSSITMNGGRVWEWMGAGDTSSITMNGGRVYWLQPSASSRLSIEGGRVGLLLVHGFSAVTMNDGEVEIVESQDSSTVTMNGGEVTDHLASYHFSTVAINGGDVGDGEAWDSLVAYDLSTITVAGTSFEVDGSPVPHGDLIATTGTLTGRLGSGDPFDCKFYQGGDPSCTHQPCTGTITLVRPPIRVPALSLSGKLLLAAALLGFGVVLRSRLH